MSLSSSNLYSTTGSDTRSSSRNQRLEDEIDCLINIVECLTSLLRKFSSIKLENQDVHDLMPSIKQTMECFALSSTLLESDLNASRIETIVFENCAEYIATLLGFSAIPIYRDSLNQKNQSFIVRIRVEALQTLSKFVTICSSVRDDPENRLSKLCVESIVENQGLEALLNMLQVDETDSIRLAISEFFFILVVKNPMGKLALVIQRAIPILLTCLNKEPYGKVRNFLCALLREFATVYPEELLKENMIGIATKLINVDASPDVRALACEILEILFKNDSRALQLLTEDSDLARVLSHRLLKDQNREVLEAACKLLETLFCLKKRTFMRKFVDIGGYASFIRVLKQCSVRPASLAVRALRYLIQNVDYDTYLGYKITTHFPSLSVLLKAVLKQSSVNPKNANEQMTIASKLLKVELAICLGIIFAKNPSSRRYVHNELKAFPLWMSTLRSALLKHLSLAELEYFSDVELVDASGVDLMEAFNADEAHHEGPAIKYVFSKQEERFTPNTEDGDLPGSLTIKDEYPDNQLSSSRRSLQQGMETEEQIGKIKSFIIIYAIHLALTPSAEDEEEQSVSQEETYEEQETAEYEHQPYADAYQSTPPPHHPQKERSARSSHKRSPATAVGVSTESPRLREMSSDLRNNLKLNLASVPGAQESSKKSTPRKSESAKRKRSTHKTPRRLSGMTPEENRFEHGIYLIHFYSVFHEDKVAQQAKNEQSPYRTVLYRKFQNSTRSQPSYQLRYAKPESPKKLQKSWADEHVQQDDLFLFEVPLEDFRLENWQRILKQLKRHHKNIKKKFVTCPQARNGRGRRTFLMDMNQNVIPRIQDLLSEFTSLIEHHGVDQIRITVYLWRGKNKDITSVHNENIVDVLRFVRDHIAKSQNIPAAHREIENEHADSIDQAWELQSSEDTQSQKRQATRTRDSDRDALLKSETDVDFEDDDDDQPISSLLHGHNGTAVRQEFSSYENTPERPSRMTERAESDIDMYEDEEEPVREAHYESTTLSIVETTVDISQDMSVSYTADDAPEEDDEAQQLAELERHVQELERKQMSERASQQTSKSHQEPEVAIPSPKSETRPTSVEKAAPVSPQEKAEQVDPALSTPSTPKEVTQEQQASPSPDQSQNDSSPAPEGRTDDDDDEDLSHLSIRERIQLRKEKRMSRQQSPQRSSVAESETSSRSGPSPAARVRERLAQRRSQRASSPISTESPAAADPPAGDVSPRSSSSIRDRVRERISSRKSREY